MPFAQLVIGPPGSGKSTYCDGMHQFLSAVGRPCSIVNLDPANDHTSYKPDLDVRTLVSLDQIMKEDDLGPNGSVLHALEILETDFDWLSDGLASLPDGDYILFDCPGQVELFTHHASLRNIFYRLQKLGYRLVVINLIDSLVLSKPSLYISSLLLSLRSMLQLDLPTLNVLTKIDQIASRDPLPFDLEFYTDAADLPYLMPYLEAEQRGESTTTRDFDAPDPEEEPPESRFHGLNNAIISLITDFSLVSFEPLFIEDKATMSSLLHAADRASGYAFGANASGADESVWTVAVRQGAVDIDVRDVQERWIDRRKEFDEIERESWRRRREEEMGVEGDGKEEEGGKDDGEDDIDKYMDGGGTKDVKDVSGIKVIRKTQENT